jgi:NADPH-dependent curcumin reductase
MPLRNLQIRVKRAPASPADFELAESAGPQLVNGSFLARTRWLALEPFACGGDAAAGAVQPGEVVPAHGVGEVIESRHEVFDVGELVVLECGLQQLCVSDGRNARRLHPGQTPASSALGVLGTPGMAAYFGLLDLARLRQGDTVLVSGAADAAGAMAGQLAMLKGARAIGIAAGREKCDWVTRHARLAACLNHPGESLTARLRQLAPHGVDIYFDQSGGELLESIVAGGHLAAGARIVQHGVADARPRAARDGVPVLRVQLRDYEHRRGEFLRDAIAWHGAGRIAARDDIVDGLANAPEHLLKALRGGNFGTALVRV